ncbi:acyl carrier protein, partial [Bacillus wiedmannii]|uniref:acyl carrier protein n=1 Tax=Bacillus wiedmannii TaxID=1890302 RepID=UPI001155409E
MSINWPLWKEGGMDVGEPTEQMLKQNMGVIPMKSESGIQAIYQGLVSNQDQVLVMEGKLTQMKQIMLNDTKSQQISQSISYSQEHVQTVLMQIVSKLLKVEIKEINVDTEWVDYGFDQFMLTDFVGKLNQVFHLELTTTIFWEYPTLHHLAGLLVNETGVQEKNLPISTIGVGEVQGKAVRYFKTLLSSVLRVPVNHIESDAPFEKYGIDSIMVMQLTNQLEKTFGSLPKTLFFEYQNIQDLTGYFLEFYGDQLIDLMGIKEKVETSTQVVPSEPVVEVVPEGSVRSRHTGSRFASVPVKEIEDKKNGALDIAIIGV